MQRYRVVIMLVLFGVLPVVAAFFVALKFLDDDELEPTRIKVPPVVEEAPPEAEPPETREVLAAARALPVGTLLDKENLRSISLDQSAVDADDIIMADPASTNALRGHAVREAIAQGAPITRSAIVGPDQKGFLATVLRPGSRAITIRVGSATSHAGLIDPGDRVDVILSAELAVDGGERSVVARTIVEDVRVVAIDSRPGTGAESAAGGDGNDVERTGIETATLEASPAQGERLVLGEHEGSLSLAVRSLAAAQNPSDAAKSAVDLREMLLSTSEFSASQARLRRVRELNDLSVRTQIVESKEQLRAAVEGGADSLKAIKVLRGSEPAEEVVFKRR